MNKRLILLVALVYMTSSLFAQAMLEKDRLSRSTFVHGGLVRMDTTSTVLYLMFTGGDYADGGAFIRKTLKKTKAPAHFFFTGDFYKESANQKLIRQLKRDGHYLGPHSDKHLLYASWENRDSLLVTKEAFLKDLQDNYKSMARFDILPKDAYLFMPPYEWYNQVISDWTRENGQVLVNFTPGTRSNADYTTPDMGQRYLGSEFIYNSILTYENSHDSGLNGFLLLIHIGTHPDRTDKFYHYLPQLINELRKRGYLFGKLQETLFRH
ncbi:MAG: polysaccharide deacetylase family protein [Bacteroidota bacterium]